MATSTGRNIIKDITKLSGKNDEDNYQLQTRLSTYYQNNPSKVLSHSQIFSNETDLNGNKVPLGGELNEYMNNTTNAPSQDNNVKALYSDEFPFWDFNCKKELDTEIIKKEEEEQKEEEQKEEFGNEESEKKSTNWGKIGIILSVILIFIILIIVTIKYNLIDGMAFSMLLESLFN